MDIEEPKLAIGKRSDHERLELVHRNTHTLFLGYYELLAVLNVVHVPHFDLAVS